MGFQDGKPQTKIFTVSALTSEIKTVLEERYPFIWIQGEISNLSRPSSGHMYFSLKDSKAQISAVIFKNQGYRLKFALENGLEISGLARLSVYEPRGTYQIIFEHIEPKGAGALQLAFEQLKAKLSHEGLFDEMHKKKPPYLPKRICVITSPSGAVIHDIIHVISKRFPDVILEIVPVKVQGDRAEIEIVEALSLVHERNNADVIIIARGGGSIEDLAPFNTEILARAVFASDIPVISAVGHETDFTICDFVADLRAPTPSAAAEWVVPVKSDLVHHISGLTSLVTSRMSHQITRKRDVLDRLISKIIDPKRKIIDKRLLIEDLTQRLIHLMENNLAYRKNGMSWKKEKLLMVNPMKDIRIHQLHIKRLTDHLISAIKPVFQTKSMHLRESKGRLSALNPLSILERGYSITRTLPPESLVVKYSDQVTLNQDVEVILSQGTLMCSVKGIHRHGQKK